MGKFSAISQWGSKSLIWGEMYGIIIADFAFNRRCLYGRRFYVHFTLRHSRWGKFTIWFVNGKYFYQKKFFYRLLGSLTFCTLYRRFSVAKMPLDSRVVLQILPGLRSYFDQPVHVKVSGLSPDQTVELRSKLIDDKGITFQASAIFCSDKNGEIDLDTCPSMGGSYSGTQAMGLFVFMRPVVPHHKIIKRDASTSLCVDIDLISNGQVLAQKKLERCFMADGVLKVPVENEGIRGTLFLPPGQSLNSYEILIQYFNRFRATSVNHTPGSLTEYAPWVKIRVFQGVSSFTNDQTKC